MTISSNTDKHTNPIPAPREPEYVTLVTRTAWSLYRWRGGHRSHFDRLDELRAAGLVPDEHHPAFAHFAAAGTAV